MDRRPSLVRDIDLIGSRIMSIMGDRTIGAQAGAIAQFMLHCKNLPCDRVMSQLEKPGARALLNKLLDCESDFMSPTPRSIGLDIVSYISADKIQKSLDVKHLQTSSGSKSIDRIIPVIRPTILYNHPTSIWVRFHTERKDVRLESGNIVRVCNDIYEIYLDKTRNSATLIRDTILSLERDWQADIIFCSELSHFVYNKLLFVSNYIKFIWCYVMVRDVFDPRTPEDMRVLCIYLAYSLLFLNTTNLTNMPETTHTPLIAYTGERPKIAMSKFKTNRVHTVEGNRAMQTVNKGSDFGTKSNFIEIISQVRLDEACIRDIL